tara:strand:- start:7563 stop:8417 length:855 start_codon:yes stop_codon:yes gene_type:complete
MNPQFKHKLGSSLAFFLEHKVLNKGQAYTNVTGELYPSNQMPFNGLNFSSSSDAQWVYDSSVLGAAIPTGVSYSEIVSGEIVTNFIDRDVSGVNLNFMNGGAYHSGTISGSATYAKKDLNFYFRNEKDVELFMEKSFNSEDPIDPITGSNDLKINAPCVILSHKDGRNNPFALGGMDENESNYQAVVISDNAYLMDGALSIFEDLTQTCFPIIDFEDIPFNIYGDLKNGEFDYTGLYSKYPDSMQQANVDRVIVNTTKISSKGADNFYLGYAEFRLLCYKFPRI